MTRMAAVNPTAAAHTRTPRVRLRDSHVCGARTPQPRARPGLWVHRSWYGWAIPAGTERPVRSASARPRGRDWKGSSDAEAQVAGVQDPPDPVGARQLRSRSRSRPALALNPYRPATRDFALIRRASDRHPRASAPNEPPDLHGRLFDSPAYDRSRPSRSTLRRTNATFAGRSARRRMKYGYHCVPNGT
jgi:hypothetical protein